MKAKSFFDLITVLVIFTMGISFLIDDKYNDTLFLFMMGLVTLGFICLFFGRDWDWEKKYKQSLNKTEPLKNG